jgi:MFS transporter, NNP family, nitrate/nitrite transporter
MAPFPFPVFPITFLTAIFYLNFVSRIILGPFLPVIEYELGLGHGEAGSLFFFLQIGHATGLVASGFLAARLGHRRAIALSSVALGGAMVAMGFAFTVGMLRLCLIFVGMGAGLYFPSGIAAITGIVLEEHWGKALALHELAPNLGFVTAPLLAEGLLAFVSWRAILALLGVVAILLGGSFDLWGVAGHLKGQMPRYAVIRRIVAQPSLWAMALLFAVGVGVSLGVYTMLPLYLVSEIGLPRARANTLVGLSRISSLGVIFLAGWLADRIGNRQALTFGLILSGTITILLGIVKGTAVASLLVICQSAAVVFFFSPALAALSRLFAAELRNLAVSVTSIVATLGGGGLVPSGIGHLAEAASFSAAFALVGALTIVSPLLLRVGAGRRP